MSKISGLRGKPCAVEAVSWTQAAARLQEGQKSSADRPKDTRQKAYFYVLVENS